ncbi:hypothetical protein [Oerskovia enterophila]|uniref:Bulb-type lectin domain-containing protein n=1 Tax=Oerskovia enterophila TaxID=43678 RepID=A0A161YF80_9CELL|nr:hypothetical protein [Oerskovia enterophila]KZM34538.1 hypothetical protein OJAG_28370 [Oerskovia enterophila]
MAVKVWVAGKSNPVVHEGATFVQVQDQHLFVLDAVNDLRGVKAIYAPGQWTRTSTADNGTDESN